MMTNFLKKHADMTNAEFEKKLRQECENNEELREEINEITGIFRRAIAKGYPNFDNRDEFYNEIDDMLKGLDVKKPVFIRDVISKEDLQEAKEIRKRLNEERMKLFINAALMNCMDLNYYLFHKKSCHDECCDCPLDSVESMIEWLGKEDDHE